MAGLCEGGNEPPSSLKASTHNIHVRSVGWPLHIPRSSVAGAGPDSAGSKIPDEGSQPTVGRKGIID
ncbi:hypothetical protein ANN_24775 [Periplaneta americana]|uniref:Uncharacterized protein n=1 Tax=Periplaneta americana TaxID=6978 RepID=A0ABQ8RZU4_PERAM|nr:hypothetical protein ANN_24775 [Periplaneta americana]